MVGAAVRIRVPVIDIVQRPARRGRPNKKPQLSMHNLYVLQGFFYQIREILPKVSSNRSRSKRTAGAAVRSRVPGNDTAQRPARRGRVIVNILIFDY
jgi:hypothetical protein